MTSLYNAPMKVIVEITDTMYFHAIENQVRTYMKKFEMNTALPKAKALLEKSGIKIEELRDYPVEGYYHETEDLRLYLKILRNLQHTEDLFKRVVQCEELEFLRKVCHNDLFGIEDPNKRNPDAILKRRYDILTLTMEDTDWFDSKKCHPWSINGIMDAISIWYKNRTNLVELAYLTKNPKCLCCGAETNSLYRMFACISGSYALAAPKVEYVWKVSPDVEELGKRIVQAYNELISDRLQVPTIDNIIYLKNDAEVPRVALLGYIAESGEYYYWILDQNQILSEMYSKEIITTESFTKKFWTGFYGNVFNASPAPDSPHYSNPTVPTSPTISSSYIVWKPSKS